MKLRFRFFSFKLKPLESFVSKYLGLLRTYIVIYKDEAFLNQINQKKTVEVFDIPPVNSSIPLIASESTISLNYFS